MMKLKFCTNPKLKIVTTDLDEINFVCTRRNPLKIRNYFKSLQLEDKIYPGVYDLLGIEEI